MKVKPSFTIDNTVVDLVKDLGSGYEVYSNNDCVDPIYYFTKDGLVLIKFSAHVQGDDMSCLTDERFELMLNK